MNLTSRESETYPEAWKDLIEYTDTNLEQRIRNLRGDQELFHSRVRKFSEAAPPTFEYAIKHLDGATGTLEIYDFSALRSARAFLRNLFGTWEDVLGTRFSVGVTTYTTWLCEEHAFEIWLVLPVEKYPKELQGENCSWEEKEQVRPEHRRKELVFSCEKKEG